MYWIVSGYVDLSMEGDILCTLGPGDFFNEPALLPVPDQVRYCRPRTTCATAGLLPGGCWVAYCERWTMTDE